MVNIVTEQAIKTHHDSTVVSLRSSTKSMVFKGGKISEMAKNLAKSCLNLIIQNNVTAINQVSQRSYFIDWIATCMDNGVHLEAMNTTAWYSSFKIL
jgi:hypothetical protein